MKEKMKISILVCVVACQISIAKPADKFKSMERQVDTLDHHVQMVMKLEDEKEIRTKTKLVLKEADAAWQNIERELSNNNGAWALWYLKGRISHAFIEFPIVENAWDSAEASYKKAIELNSKYFEAHLALGNLYSGPIESMEKAISEFQKAILADSVQSRKSCYLALSYAYLNLNNINQAEIELAKHLKWNAENETSIGLKKILEIRRRK